MLRLQLCIQLDDAERSESDHSLFKSEVPPDDRLDRRTSVGALDVGIYLMLANIAVNHIENTTAPSTMSAVVPSDVSSPSNPTLYAVADCKT